MSQKICDALDCRAPAARDICRKHQIDVRYWRLEPAPHWKTRPNPPCDIDGCERPAESQRMETPMCKVHRDHIRAGRDLGKVRAKARNGAQLPKCIHDNCERSARARGMCDKHYAAFRYEHKTRFCGRDGCEVSTINLYCHKHRIRPRMESKYSEGVCTVPGCDKPYRSMKYDICKSHAESLRWIKVAPSELKQLRGEAACQACGSSERLVIDHHHGCHPESKQKMCKACIRGVLCSHCNTALGLLGESPQRIVDLLAYLQTKPAGAYFNKQMG